MTRKRAKDFVWFKYHRSLTFAEIFINLSELYGQFGHNIAHPIGAPIVSAEWRSNCPIWDEKCHTDGLSATIEREVVLK